MNWRTQSYPKNPIILLIGILKAVCFLAVLGSTVIVCNLLQMSSFLLLPISKRAARYFNHAVAFSWWCLLIYWNRWIGGLKIVYSGDELPQKANALVVCNHQAMSDIPALLDLSYRQGCLAGNKYFAKAELAKVPGLGWGMRLLDFLMVRRSWAEDAEYVRALFEKLRNYKTIPIWIVTFPEGTRIRPKKLARSQEFMARINRKKLENVMLPRTKGFTATLSAFSDKLDGVYDLTIGYKDGKPNLIHMAAGFLDEIHVNVRRFSISELPKTEAEQSNWLMDRFEAKDELMRKFYLENHF